MIKLILMTIISLLLSCNTTSAKEKITWMVLDWPPWMILDGENKGTGRFNSILETAKENLKEYEHVEVRMNWARFWHEIESKKNLCYTFGLKSGKREKIVHYSVPHTFVLPNAVIMKKETAQMLGNPESISIVQLLKEARLKGYAEKNRSFTRDVDLIMKDHEKGSNLQRVSESAESLLKMVMMGRSDYTIEYPIVSNYYQGEFGMSGTLVSVPISEMAPYSYVYMNCTKNEWGKNVIDKWNSALKKIKPTDEYRKITEIGHTSEIELSLIRKYYDSFVEAQK